MVEIHKIYQNEYKKLRIPDLVLNIVVTLCDIGKRKKVNFEYKLEQTKVSK